MMRTDVRMSIERKDFKFRCAAYRQILDGVNG